MAEKQKKARTKVQIDLASVEDILLSKILIGL